MKLCKCQGTRGVTFLAAVDYMFLENGGHTAFDILRCNRCGRITGIPEENLILAVDQGTAKTKKILAEFFEENSYEKETKQINRLGV
jgi:hypothetical protein